MAEGWLTKAAKKLEQVLGVPRPWELTPATSVGYQMVTGQAPLSEDARKGIAQFIGRYATNYKPPFGYGLPEFKPMEVARSVIRDESPWIERTGKWAKTDPKQITGRDLLYREMFDLPARREAPALIKTGQKSYTLAGEGGSIFLSPEPNRGIDPILANTYIEGWSGEKPAKGKIPKYKYRDTWDIMTAGEDPKRIFDSSGTLNLRATIAPYLRPATVSGEITKPQYERTNEL